MDTMGKAKEYVSLPTKVTLAFICISSSELVFKTEQIYYALAIATLALLFAHRGFNYRKTPAIRMLFYGIIAFLSCFWTPHPNTYMTTIVKIVTAIFLILQLQFDYSQYEYELIKKAFIFQFIFLFILCLVFGDYGDGRLWVRNNGVTTDPNCIAGWVIIPLCISLETFFKEGTGFIKKCFSGTIVAASCFIVMWGASRTGIVVNALAVTLCVLYSFRNTILRKPLESFFIIVAFVIVAYIVYLNIPPIMIQRFSQRDTGALGGRSYLWSDMMKAMKEHPWSYLCGFGEEAARYYTTERNVAHNIFLDVLFSQGIPALLLVCTYILNSFRNIMKRDGYLAIAYFCLIILSCALNSISQRFMLLIFFLASMRVYQTE